jgi:hypothetical protein
MTARRDRMVVLAALGLMALSTAAAAQNAGSAAQAGVAAAVRGEVRQVSFAPPPTADQTVNAPIGRVVASGDRIFLGDRIETGPRAGLQIMLLDETIFTIGPNAAMVIDTFVYDPATDAGEVTASIVKGAFRFVSGRIAKRNPSDMNVKLPVATIGIRGTSVAGEVVEQTPTTPASAEVILLGPGAENNADERAGRVIVDNAGTSIEISRPGFGTTISGSQAPPAPPVRVPPARIAALGGNLAGTGGSGGDQGGGQSGQGGGDSAGGGGGDSADAEGGNGDAGNADGNDNDTGDGQGGSEQASGGSPAPGTGTSAGSAAPANASQGSGDTSAPGPAAVSTVSGPGGGGTTFAAGAAAPGGATAPGSGPVGAGGSAPALGGSTVSLPNLGGVSGLNLGSSIAVVQIVSQEQNTGQNTTSTTITQTNNTASQLSTVTTFQQLLSDQVSGTGTFTMTNVPLLRQTSPIHNGQVLTASGKFDAQINADFSTKKLELVVNNVAYNYQTVISGTLVPFTNQSFTFNSNAQPAGGQFDDNNYGNELGPVAKTWTSNTNATNFPVVPTEPFSGVKHQVEVSAKMLNDVPNNVIGASGSVDVKITITHNAGLGNTPTILSGGQTASRN